MNFRVLKKATVIICVMVFTFSCNTKKTKEIGSTNRDLLLRDSLYKIKQLEIEYGDTHIEQMELYISKTGDTISNQLKIYNNEKIDTLNSAYYDLEIHKTKKPNIYIGQITVHTKYDHFDENQKNRRTLDFRFSEQHKDSIRVTTKQSKLNTIDFEFENFYDNRLQGIIYFSVERDTVVNGEKMVNLYNFHMLIDNKPVTDNLFLKAYEMDKKNKFKL